MTSTSLLHLPGSSRTKGGGKQGKGALPLEIMRNGDMKNSEYIRNQAGSWTGVSAHPHRFGGTEYRLGRREIGHVHGERLVDIPFPKRVRDELVASGEAQAHHVLPESGWVSVYLRSQDDVTRAAALLRRSFELALAQAERRREREL